MVTELWTDFSTWPQTCLVTWTCWVITGLRLNPVYPHQAWSWMWPSNRVCSSLLWTCFVIWALGWTYHLWVYLSCLVQVLWDGALTPWLCYQPLLPVSLVLSDCVVWFHRYHTIWLLVLWLSETSSSCICWLSRKSDFFQNTQQFPRPTWLKILSFMLPLQAYAGESG